MAWLARWVWYIAYAFVAIAIPVSGLHVVRYIRIAQQSDHAEHRSLIKETDMLHEFLDLLARVKPHENDQLQLLDARWNGEGCTLCIAIALAASDQEQVWVVHCADARAHHMKSGWVASAGLHAAHPLLAAYTERRVQLVVHGRASNPDAGVGQLWQTHRDVAANWYPFAMFLNPRMVPAAILASGGGLLADGPKSVLQAYANVLRENDVPYAFLSERSPTRWRDGQWQPEPPDLRALVLGESYIIGADFHAWQEPGAPLASHA